MTPISAHAAGHIDPTASSSLYQHIPDVPATLVHVSYAGDYQFNPALRRIKGPIVLVDFMEYFGFYSDRTHLFNNPDLPVNMEDWRPFADWVSEIHHNGQLNCYFKRELFGDCQDPTVHPVEWPCVHPAWQLEPKSNFDKRPFDVFNNWGYSNAARPRFHGQCFELMAEGKIEVVSHWDHIAAKENEPQPKWITIHSPHTHRRHIDDILRLQAKSKCSVSLPGSGVVCFRSTEAPVHTIKAVMSNDRRWSIPWEHGVNCLEVSTAAKLHADLDEMRNNLHDIYRACYETTDRYRSTRYIHEYFLPTLLQHL
jgi:hypothetical protein